MLLGKKHAKQLARILFHFHARSISCKFGVKILAILCYALIVLAKNLQRLSVRDIRIYGGYRAQHCLVLLTLGACMRVIVVGLCVCLSVTALTAEVLIFAVRVRYLVSVHKLF